MRDRDCAGFLKDVLPRIGLQWSGYRKVHRTVCKRLRRRLHALGLGDLEAYRGRVLTDPGERAELDAMCRIPVSRFGRDRAVFEALVTRVLPELAARRPNHVIRCWSCGCASGEEPYTLQILWRLRARTGRLRIVATDAEPHMLERARTGCYKRGSLRELSAAEIARAFTPTGDLLCVRPEFRVDMEFLCQDVRVELPEGRFHLILCRNLLFTYFAPASQQRLLSEIAAKLTPGGFLVLGRKEALPKDSPAFERPVPELPLWRKRE